MVSINLIPDSLQRALARRARLLAWSVCVSGSAFCAAVPYGFALVREAQAAQERRELGQLDEQATAIRHQLRTATASAQETMSKLDRSRALRAKRSWSGMLALVARSMPPQCWLTSVATDPEAPGAAPVRSNPLPAVPGKAASPVPDVVTIEAPQKLRLIGQATTDVAPLSLVRSLRESNAFVRVALEKTTRAQAAQPVLESLYQFEVVCEW